MIYNVLPGLPHFDSPPWYPVMLYMINIFQGLMLPLLMVGQQVLARGQEQRQVHEAKVIDHLNKIMERLVVLEEKNTHTSIE